MKEIFRTWLKDPLVRQILHAQGPLSGRDFAITLFYRFLLISLTAMTGFGLMPGMILTLYFLGDAFSARMKALGAQKTWPAWLLASLFVLPILVLIHPDVFLHLLVPGRLLYHHLADRLPALFRILPYINLSLTILGLLALVITILVLGLSGDKGLKNSLEEETDQDNTLGRLAYLKKLIPVLLVYMAGAIVFTVVMLLITAFAHRNYSSYPVMVLSVAWWLASLIIGIYMLVLHYRRIRNTGASGWWLLSVVLLQPVAFLMSPMGQLLVSTIVPQLIKTEFLLIWQLQIFRYAYVALLPVTAFVVFATLVIWLAPAGLLKKRG